MRTPYSIAGRCAALAAGLGLVALLVSGAAGQPPRKVTEEKNVNAPEPTPTGEKTGLIPRAVLFGNPDKAAPHISPDGKLLSYLAPVNGVLNVWVGPIDRPDEAKPVTQDKKRGIRAYFWAFTGRHVLYIQDTDGDEDFHLYGVDLKENTTRDLTPLKKIRAEVLGVSYKFPKEIIVGLNDREPHQFHDLYRINIETGERKLIQKNDRFVSLTVDDDYVVRVGQQFAADGGVQYFEPDGKDGWKELFKVSQADSLTTGISGFDKTGQVAYLIDSRERDTAAVKTWDLRSGQQAVVAEDPRCDAGGIMTHPTEKAIQAVSFTYERTRWEFKDKGVEADFAELKKVADGEIEVGSKTLDDRQWIVTFAMDDGPVRFYHYDRDTKKARFLFTNRKALEGLPLRKLHPVVIKSRDGLDLVCYYTLPPGADRDNGKPERPLPMVLDVHGGPWARDEWGLHPEHQLLANRGYAVLSVNFRGSTGFGKKFLNAANKEWAGKMHEDLLDAVDWAVKEKIADPAKVAIMGGSYGGYATLVGLTFTPEKFACGVDIVGPSNIVTLLKTIPPYWAPAIQLFKDRVGDHTTPEGVKFLESRSPLSKVDQINKPLLIGQGANDPRVKQTESDQIVKAMKEKNIPVTYVLFPDEGHGFARPENRLAFYAVAEAFLAKHLGGRYEAIGEAFKGSTVTVPNGSEDVPGLAGKAPTKVEKAAEK